MANTVVIAFVQKGCGACEEFLPRLRRIAARHRGVPLVVVDVADPKAQGLADRFGVKYTPTTVLARRPHGVITRETAVGNNEVESLFHLAERCG